MSKTLLVTGGAGFIASHFIHYLRRNYPEYHILNVDKMTYAGSEANLKAITSNKGYDFIEGDIADEPFINQLFSDYDIHGVIHFAAESHVDRSIRNVKTFIESNVLGTAVLLQAAREAWARAGELGIRRFHHISTDEVYGALDLDDQATFNEQTPLDPRNPYSASKASADMLVKSFGLTYGMNVVISSSSNNYGPGQHAEKLIPTVIAKALDSKSVPIYGDGQNVRDWLYVTDHCEALDRVFHNGEALEKYNIGGGNEQTNIALATMICELLDEFKPSGPSYKDQITLIGDRQGHDRRYAIDDRKIRQELGWQPSTSFATGLYNTVRWYVDKWEHQTR